MGPGVGDATDGRSATRAYLGLIGELPRVNSRAPLLALTAPIGMRALSHPPQSTQRRDLTLYLDVSSLWWLGYVLREQSSKSHQERLQRPQGAHVPRRCLACRAPREASAGGRMRAGLRLARRAKPAETLT